MLVEGFYFIFFNQNEGYGSQGKEESCEARESSGSEKEDASDNVSNVLLFLSGGYLNAMLVLLPFPLHNIQFKEFLVLNTDP